MSDSDRARVGLLGLMFKLYDRLPDLKPKQAQFANRLVETLSPFAEVDFPGICDTLQQVDEAVAGFEKNGADLLLVVFLSYAPSLIALPALKRTSLPILILNTQELYAVDHDTRETDLLENHGMHGVQDLANVLIRAGCRFHILTGHYGDEVTIAELRSWCDAARGVRFFHQARIALMGYPMQQMGDIAIDETALLTQLGVTVERIPIRIVAETAAQAPAAAIAEQMATDRRLFQVDPAITSEEHAASSRLEWAIRRLLQEGAFEGWAAHFLAFEEDGRVETLPFLAACKLLAEGYGFGGEGDVTSATAVSLMRVLTGTANFTEMFTIDFRGNGMLMNHMGEGNYRMARSDEPIRLLRRPFALVNLTAPVSLCFSLEPGAATLLSLTTGPKGRLRFIIAEGQVADFPTLKGVSSPHYKFLPATSVSQFLTRFSEEGGSHHQALVYGHIASKVEKVAHLLNLDYALI